MDGDQTQAPSPASPAPTSPAHANTDVASAPLLQAAATADQAPQPETASQPETATTPQPTPVEPIAKAPPAAAGERTQARLSKPRRAGAKPGARSRTRNKEAAAEAAADPVAVFLQTSRVLGPDGRAVARRTVVLASPSRAAALIERGWARAATSAEGKTAVITLT